MAQVPSMTRRLTIEEQITGIIEGEDEMFFSLMDELETELIEAQDLRPYSAKTQREQDRKLALYYMCIKMFYRKPMDTPTADVEKLAFPDDHTLLEKLLRNFIVYIAKKQNSSLPARAVVMYQTLERYRRAMLFWIQRLYRDREMPNKSKLYNGMTLSMQSIYRKLYGPGRGMRRKMPRVGLAEMRQLIDEDAVRSACPENAEQHHLIWCLGHQTAVRAASLAEDADRKGQYLQWRDIEFSRSGPPGSFKAMITYRHLKSNRIDPEKGDQNTLVCNCECPNEDNIVFSIPHRLLAIAIRRNLLVDIDSVDALLQSNLQNILIKPAHLKDPVFYASKPRGLELDTKAMSVAGIQHYLRSRGRNLGYGRDISFHAFRRQTATDLVRAVGYERTRQIMAHAPDSRTLERYYVNLQSTTDLTGLAFNPDSVGPLGATGAVEPDRPSMTNLSDIGLQGIRGSALNTMVQQMIDADPDFPGQQDPRAYKNYMKRARRIAMQSLTEHEQRLQRETMTHEQYEARLDNQTIFAFADAVRAQAEQNARRLHDQTQAHANDQDDATYNEDFAGVDDDVAIDEPDIEDVSDMQQKTNTGASHVIQITGPEFEPIAATDVPFIVTVRTFLDVLMQNTLIGHKRLHQPWAERPTSEKQCRLCNEDDSTLAATKLKVFDNETKLRLHMMGEFHSKRAVQLRWLKIQHLQQEADDNAWYCPYGEAIHVGYKHTHLENLLRHIRNSTAQTAGQDHDDSKAVDGWYDDDWTPLERTSTAKKEAQRRWRDVIKDLEVEFPTAKRIELTRDKDQPWLLHGSTIGLPPGTSMLRVTNGTDQQWQTENKAAIQALVDQGLAAGANTDRGREIEAENQAALEDIIAKGTIKRGGGGDNPTGRGGKYSSRK